MEKGRLQRELDRVYDLYEEDLAKADGYDKQQEIQQLQEFECSEFDDKIQRIDSLELTNRASRCHIDVSDLPPPEEAPHHWMMGRHGTWFLHPRSFRLLAKAVEAAEHERTQRALITRRDLWVKLVTPIAAAVAAIAGLINLLISLGVFGKR